VAIKFSAFFIPFLQAICLCANAADAPANSPDASVPASAAEAQTVTLTSAKDPLFKSYRAMWAGMEAYEQFRQFAPNAPLKFTLIRYGDVNKFASDWKGVKLRIAGSEDHPSISIPIAADGTFVVPRVQSAYDDDAELILNQKKSHVGGMPEIKTAGLPPNTRRLGDLRLECQVVQAIAKKDVNLLARAAVNTFTLGSNLCNFKSIDLGRTASDRMVSVTLMNGNQRRDVRFSGTKFFPPIQDKSVPDDALIEFVYWSQASVEAKQAYFARYPIVFKGSLDSWGKDVLLRADPHTGTPTSYSVKVKLRVRDYAFRLIDQDKRVEYGTWTATPVQAPAEAVPMAWRGRDFVFRCTREGEYVFTVNVQNPDAPALTIKRIE
jgi:hypothetical protein